MEQEGEEVPKKQSWTDEQLTEAVKVSCSIRGVIKMIGLVPAGGNYLQVNYAIARLRLDTGHFTGSRWNVGKRYSLSSTPALETLLIKGGAVQSYKLKAKLFAAKIKKPECELCGWARQSPDGRIPVELDHINGDHADNRLENLRILCPNCHSLQLTHRGKNKKVRLRRLTK